MTSLLEEIEKFIAAHSLSESAFGELALKDRHFIRQLRLDREPRRATVERVRSFMVTYRPSAEQQAA
jgi:hypothetical protein